MPNANLANLAFQHQTRTGELDTAHQLQMRSMADEIKAEQDEQKRKLEEEEKKRKQWWRPVVGIGGAVLGGGLGFLAGGPVGAMAGASIGGGLGREIAGSGLSNYAPGAAMSQGMSQGMSALAQQYFQNRLDRGAALKMPGTSMPSTSLSVPMRAGPY